MLQRLALGHQEFSVVREYDCIYVDKTEIIHKLVSQGNYFFLSRPRRFGKSLLANTIKELFKGRKELFEGLWIYDKWDWEKSHPVIKISFSNIDHEKLGLEQAIDLKLYKIAESYGLELKMGSNATKFQELLEKLAKKERVVIIIDEYDKPIIDYLDNIEKAEENKLILKNFYSVLKDADEELRFLFITGVSKFSQVSIFSDLNNLKDITLSGIFSEIVGWNQSEVENYFPEYIKQVEERYKKVYPDIYKAIKEWYNGYSWDGKNKVYNPVSLMFLFENCDFRNYWFATGTPTFLIKYLRKENILPFAIERSVVASSVLDKYEIDNITILPLLFQTGYLTIEDYNLATGEYTLVYPNREVALSFSEHFLAEHTTGKLDFASSLLYKIRMSFYGNNIEELVEHLNALFANIPYTLVERSEKYFHSLFYLVMKIIGYNIQAEILTIKGRIDAVVQTPDNIFIIEFKINQSAEKGIGQIKEMKYAAKFTGDKRPVILLGINFDTENKVIDDYMVEETK